MARYRWRWRWRWRQWELRAVVERRGIGERWLDTKSVIVCLSLSLDRRVGGGVQPLPNYYYISVSFWFSLVLFLITTVFIIRKNSKNQTGFLAKSLSEIHLIKASWPQPSWNGYLEAVVNVASTVLFSVKLGKKNSKGACHALLKLEPNFFFFCLCCIW